MSSDLTSQLLALVVSHSHAREPTNLPPSGHDVIGRGLTGKTWRPRSSDRIRADLEKAGQPKDAAGKPLDFHSTRRFFATALARAGVEPEIRKLLMRHSTGDVTEDCYTDREVEQLYEAVCRIHLDLAKGDALRFPLAAVAAAS